MTGFRGKEAAFTHAHAGFAPMDVVPCGNNGRRLYHGAGRDGKPLHMAFGEKGGRCYYLGEEADWK